jgi:hypothetical protein
MGKGDVWKDAYKKRRMGQVYDNIFSKRIFISARHTKFESLRVRAQLQPSIEVLFRVYTEINSFLNLHNHSKACFPLSKKNETCD